jgi:hypothetical protein
MSRAGLALVPLDTGASVPVQTCFFLLFAVVCPQESLAR